MNQKTYLFRSAISIKCVLLAFIVPILTSRVNAVEMASRAIYTFTNGSPKSPLLLTSNHVFYGTTQFGGAGFGSIFSITLAGAFTQLYALNSSDGANPTAALVQGRDGDLYGTADSGGTNGYGSIFKISTNGAFTPLYSFFNGNDGAGPAGGLTLGTNGNFYGTTPSGGSYGLGTLFEITSNGMFTVIYSSTNGVDGSSPSARLTQAPDGNLYGVTSSGGGPSGFGTIFRITPSRILTTLYSFTNGVDGANPNSPLTLGPDDALYGGVQNGGLGYGIIYKVTLSGALTPLHVLTISDGYYPVNALTLGSDHKFYGTLYYGGDNGYGSIFTITTNGEFSKLVNISPALASVPSALTEGPGGNFFGTSSQGGAQGAGTVFEVSPFIAAPGLGAELPASELKALVDLYNQDDGKHWGNSSGWPDAGAAAWFGVTASAPTYDTNWNLTALGHVTSVALNGNNLHGMIPMSLTNLSFLQFLNLSSDNLTGPLPDFDNFHQLQTLDVSFNSLTSLPDSLADLGQLQSLALNNNNFAGPLPGGLGNLTNLTSLNLAQNQFSGTLPPDITSLRLLQSLLLNNNSFSGSLPSSIGNLTNLQALSLDNNFFSGTIPGGITNLTGVYNIYLDFNDFTGSIPSGIGQLRAGLLDFSFNMLSGRIPGSLTNLVTLSTLYLNDNQLTGSIPTGLHNITGLQTLDLADNRLSGSIPKDLTNQSLNTLDLENNFLTGSIPNGLTNLFLETLDLSYNFLSGSIPAGLGINGGYNVLLSFNNLTGSIPSSLTNLYSFGQLWLDNNFLSDPIPGPLPYELYLQDNDFDVTPGSPEYQSLTNLASTHLGLFEPQNSELDYSALQLIQNGGFEAGSFTNWGLTGNVAQNVSVSSYPQDVHSGADGALLGSMGGPGFLYQKIPTLPGVRYLVSFWLNNPDPVGPNEFAVAWDGSILLDSSNLAAAGWANIQLQATASSSNSLVQFAFRNDDNFFGLDDVTVSVAPPTLKATLSGDQLLLSWNTGEPWSYRLDSSPDLVHWTLGTVVPATQTLMTASVAITPGVNIFYRVVMLPPP